MNKDKKLSEFTMGDIVEQSFYALAAFIIVLGVVLLIAWLCNLG